MRTHQIEEQWSQSVQQCWDNLGLMLGGRGHQEEKIAIAMVESCSCDRDDTLLVAVIRNDVRKKAAVTGVTTDIII